MSNLFKESLKFMTMKIEKDSPLIHELPKQTKLTNEIIGKHGILGNEKLGGYNENGR